jgi:hypothetical protein
MHHRRKLGETDHDFLSRIAPDYLKMWKEKKARGATRVQARATGRRLQRELSDLIRAVEDIAAGPGSSDSEADRPETMATGDPPGARPLA